MNELTSNIDEVKDVLKATITNVLADVHLDELHDLDEQIRNLQRELMELHAKNHLEESFKMPMLSKEVN